MVSTRQSSIRNDGTTHEHPVVGSAHESHELGFPAFFCDEVLFFVSTVCIIEEKAKKPIPRPFFEDMRGAGHGSNVR